MGGWNSVLSLGKSVFKGAGKVLYTPGKTAVKEGVEQTSKAKGVLPYIYRNPKNTLALGGAGFGIYGYTSGKGVFGAASELIPGTGGLAGFASDALFGKNTDGKDAIEKVGSALIGESTTKKVSDAVSSGVDAISGAVSKGVDMVKDAANAVGDMFSGIFSFFGGGMNPATADSAVSGVGGFRQMLSSLLGRSPNLSVPAVAMTVLGAWLGFGNHGFTGKIAGALLGALGLKNMFGGGQDMSVAQSTRVSQQQDNDLDRQETVDSASTDRHRAVSPVYDNSEILSGDYLDDGVEDVNGIEENKIRKTAYRR